MLHTSRFSQYSITPISGTKDSFSSKVEMSPAGFQFRQDCVFEQEAGERWTAAHCRTSLHVIDCGYRTVWTSVLEEADNLAFATALSFSWLHYTLTQSPIFHLSLHWYSNKSGYWLVLVLHHQASKITATSCLHESVKKKVAMRSEQPTQVSKPIRTEGSLPVSKEPGSWIKPCSTLIKKA
jgi:hypothetical protein